MLREGLLERFGIDEVHGMHNWPGLEVGWFATRSGPMMAAGDRFMVTVRGQGGHAAFPHRTIDPVLTAAHMTVALQSIVSRYVDPMDPVVLSVTTIHGGDALNVIAETAQIGGTIRTLLPETRSAVEARFRSVVEATASGFGATAEIDWRPGYPVTVTDPEKTALAVLAAEDVSGNRAVDADYPRVMGSEDFSYMLEQRPGSIVWLGNGASAELHHPAYNFNDEAIQYGIAYWIKLVGRATAEAGRV
jgi:hippurate hydrolase